MHRTCVLNGADMVGATWNCCRLGAFCVHHTTTHNVTSCEATCVMYMRVLNPGSFNHESDTVTTEFSPLPVRACVCVCMCACARACVCVRAWVRARARVCVCVIPMSRSVITICLYAWLNATVALVYFVLVANIVNNYNCKPLWALMRKDALQIVFD